MAMPAGFKPLGASNASSSQGEVEKNFAEFYSDVSI